MNSIPVDHEASDFDRVRPNFMHHVVSPMAHLAIVQVVDAVREDFLNVLKNTDGAEIRDVLTNDGLELGTAASIALGFVHQSLLSTLMEHGDVGVRIEDVLSGRQLTAVYRFTSIVQGADITGALGNASRTIPRTIDTIHSRHAELGLASVEGLTSFLRSPFTPGILRGFAIGGNGFPDSLGGFNKLEAGAPWREDPAKPVLDTTGSHPRTLKEVRDAAYEHRDMAAAATHGDSFGLGNGIVEIAMRYSDGCPMRRLGFSIDDAELKAEELNLTEEQVLPLIQGSQPIATKVTEAKYRILRDGLAAMCGLLADGVEIVLGGSHSAK
jgi:hypothetical protein